MEYLFDHYWYAMKEGDRTLCVLATNGEANAFSLAWMYHAPASPLWIERYPRGG